MHEVQLRDDIIDGLRQEQDWMRARLAPFASSAGGRLPGMAGMTVGSGHSCGRRCSSCSSGIVFGARFAPSRELPFEEVKRRCGAVNAGLPFQLAYPGSGRRAAGGHSAMSDVYGDYGILLVVSLAGSAGRQLFGPSFQLRLCERRE